MANTNPIVPIEAGKATRFRPGPDPRRHVPRRSTRMMIAERLDEVGPDGRTPNQDILDHMIEVATKWDVVVVGHGDEPISVASARDAVKAAEVLWSYALGKAPAGESDFMLRLAEHFRGVAKDKAELAIKLLGDTLKTKSPEDVAAAFRVFADNPRGFLDAAEAHIRGEDSQVEGEAHALDETGDRCKLGERLEPGATAETHPAITSQGACVPPEPASEDPK